jgi:hypothetical protein
MCVMDESGQIALPTGRVGEVECPPVEFGPEAKAAQVAEQFSGLQRGRSLLLRLLRPAADRSPFFTKGVGMSFEAVWSPERPKRVAIFGLFPGERVEK